MKVISRIAIVAFVALVVAASVQPVSATCGNGRLISSFQGGSQYITSAGLATAASLGGNFWALNTGIPGAGSGTDNGADAPTGNASTDDDWLRVSGGGLYIAGNWATGSVDGCIDTDASPAPKRTIVAITDSTPDHAYIKVLCQQADILANYPLGALGNTTMAAMPYPKVLSSSRVAGVSVTVNVKSPAADLADVVLADASCPATLIRGYKLYTQTKTNASGVPADRARSAGWTQEGTEIPIAQDAPGLTKSCTAGQSVYVAASLVFDSGFETAHVGQDIRVPCDPSLADRPGKFKIIKKPGVQDRQQ